MSCLSCSTPELLARGRTFACNNLFGRGRQSHLGLVVLGPLLLPGNLGGHLVFLVVSTLQAARSCNGMGLIDDSETGIAEKNYL